MQNMGGKTALGLDSNVGALLCYLPVCAISLIYSIIVLVTEKSNKTVRYHAFHSLLMSAVFFVILIGLVLTGTVLGLLTQSFIIGSIMLLFYVVVGLAFLILMIVGCIKGYQGGSYKLPVIGNMAEKWS